MPYKSKRQQAYFHYLEAQGKLPKSIDINEWDDASKGEELPEHLSRGGMIYGYGSGDDAHDNEYSFHENDVDHPMDSTGEPHTSHDEEEEKPMEFADGGFVKALRRRRR